MSIWEQEKGAKNACDVVDDDDDDDDLQ